MLSFIQWHQLPALRIFVAQRLLFTAFFGTASEGGSIFWTPGISKKSSKSSIADPKWHLRWWKNILHTGQFVVNSLILLPYQLGSHHISCANRVSLLKSFSPKCFSLPYFSDAKRTNNYFMNTLENEHICNLMMYQVELEEFFGSSFPFWCDFAYLPLTAKAWIFLADWRMSYRSRQPGEVSYLLSIKIMPLVRKEHWNASSGNRELIFNMKAVFSTDLKIQWRFRRKRPSFFPIWSPNLFKEFIFEARGYRLPHFLWWNPGKIVPCHPKKIPGEIWMYLVPETTSLKFIGNGGFQPFPM